MAQTNTSILMSSPFWATSPEGTIAFANQLMDDSAGVNKKQSVINQEVQQELADLGLTQEELEAIINEVDLDGIRIIATPQAGQSGDDFAIYRFEDGDVERAESKNDICFSKPDGTKYYLNVEYSKKALDDDPGLWTEELIGEVLYGEVEGKSDSHYQVKKVENVPSNS